MNRHTLVDRLRYGFDNLMARGTIALIVGLFLLAVVIVVAVAALVVLLGGMDDETTAGIVFIQLMWLAALRTLDPGTMADDAGSLVFVFGMLSATMAGLLLVAILIGLVTSGIEGRLSALRRGRSRVIEEDHTIILGWSPHSVALIAELIEANASKRNQCIVVLGERDKVEMEEELAERLPDRRTTRLVCRSGSPIDPADIDICSPQTARSMVVLSNGGPDADASVIKRLLAIANSGTRRAAPYRLVAEIQDAGNVGVARLAAHGEARIVLVGELIGRIAAQACRQSGLSVVYEELLDFTGDEIYYADHLGLAGTTFGEALHELPHSSLIGIAPASGPPQIDPPMERVIAESDRLVVIATDDSTIRTGERPPGVPSEQRIARPSAVTATTERTLVLGWNRRAAGMLLQLDRYVAAGSSTVVVSSIADHRAAVEAVGAQMGNTRLDFRHADTTARRVLEELLVDEWDHVAIMAYSDSLAEPQADARTMVTLLHLRDIAAGRGQRPSIVTEMLDLRNRELARVTRGDDFIVSEKLVSQMLAQLSENPELEAVFAKLFDVEGAEIYLRPTSNYLRLEHDHGAVDFHTVVESARRQSQVAVGYRLMAHADDAARNYGVVLNPDKPEPISLTAEDQIIVLADG